MKILLLSPYHGDSHRWWCEQLIAGLPEHDWTLLDGSPRHFAWRMRGNGLQWALQESGSLAAEYDVVVATSITDLAGLRGMVPGLARLPALLYFHENQFAYPDNPRQQGVLDRQLQQITAAVAANRLIFNSRFNRDSFLAGVAAFCAAMPDGLNGKALCASLSAKSAVLPVPLRDDDFSTDVKAPLTAVPELVWNHRREHDKQPELLLAFLQACESAGLICRVHILGREFRRQPEAFSAIDTLLAKARYLQAGHQGYVASREAYLALLRQADVVLSTAAQEFQGLAVMEAVASGCLPLVPDRLSYPEFFSAGFCYPTDGSLEQVAAAMLTQLRQLLANPPQPPSLSHLYWSSLAEGYRRELRDVDTV